MVGGRLLATAAAGSCACTADSTRLAVQVLSFAGSERVSRRLRATVGAFWGRGHLPLPHNTDIIMAMGPPIPVKQVGSGWWMC